MQSTVNIDLTLNGVKANVNKSGGNAGSFYVIPPTVILPAKPGTLSVRGSNTAGTAALGSGHGFTTAQKDVSIFWSGGSRRNVLVGTVSGNNVPFSGGTGDNLPSLNDAIAVMAPLVITETIDFSALVNWLLITSGTAYCIVSVGTTTTGTYTEGAAVIMNKGIWGPSAIFDSVYTLANVLTASGASNTLKISHGDGVSSQTFQAVFGQP